MLISETNERVRASLRCFLDTFLSSGSGIESEISRLAAFVSAMNKHHCFMVFEEILFKFLELFSYVLEKQIINITWKSGDSSQIIRVRLELFPTMRVEKWRKRREKARMICSGLAGFSDE